MEGLYGYVFYVIFVLTNGGCQGNIITPSESPLNSTSISTSPESSAAISMDIVAGCIAGGIIIFIGLVVCIIVLIIRRRNRKNSKETYTDYTCNGFENKIELNDTSLYAITKPVDELESTSGKKQQLIRSKRTLTSNACTHYDVPTSHRPKDRPYAVPKKRSIKFGETSKHTYSVPKSKPVKVGSSQFPGYAVPKRIT